MSINKKRFLLCGFYVLLFSNLLLAQDTLRFVIPQVSVSPADTTFEIPVLLFYDGELAGIQTEVAWEADGFTLDSVIAGPIIPAGYQFLASQPTSVNSVRIAISPGGNFEPFTVGEDSVAFVLHFSTDKPLEDFTAVNFFEGNIQTSAFDIFGNDVPSTTMNGGFFISNSIFKASFSEARSNLSNTQICLDLISEGIPRSHGHQFSLQWDEDEFTFDQYQLYNNPLILDEAEVSINGGAIMISATSSERVVTDSLIQGVRLIELCFLANSISSTSQISMVQEPAPFFKLPSSQGGDVVLGPVVIDAGDLEVNLPGITDTVKLAISGNALSQGDTIGCVKVFAELFDDINRFNFQVRWPDNLNLASIDLSEEGQLGNTLSIESQTTERVLIKMNSSDNISLPQGRELAELCFSGELDLCDPSVIEIEQQPFSTFFSRLLPHFSTSLEVPFIGRSGNLLPIGGDTLKLALQEVVRDSSDSQHSIKLENLSDICFTAFNFSVEFDSEELQFIDFIISEEVAGDYEVFQLPSGDPSFVDLSLSQVDVPNSVPLVRGVIGELVFERIGEKDTVDVFLRNRNTPFSAVVVEGGGSLRLIPVNLTDGRIVFSNITSIQTVNNNYQTLEIYPNPTSDLVTIKGLNETRPFEFVLFGPLGRKVRTGTINEGNSAINFQNLPAGSYWLRVSQNGKLFINKLIVK